MSYDLMGFEPNAAPTERQAFMAWYDQQTKWSEEHSYDNPDITSHALQAWLKEMVEHFPALNGPLASEDDDDSPHVSDYCIGRHVVYVAFAWSCSDEAYATMRKLAIKHDVGFFDVSSKDGEIYIPGMSPTQLPKPQSPWWKFW